MVQTCCPALVVTAFLSSTVLPLGLIFFGTFGPAVYGFGAVGSCAVPLRNQPMPFDRS